jgi:hypothetical protein
VNTVQDISDKILADLIFDRKKTFIIFKIVNSAEKFFQLTRMWEGSWPCPLFLGRLLTFSANI